MVDMELIRKFPLFKDLDDRELAKFADSFTVKRYPAGTIICPQGSKGAELYLIKTGSVTIELPLHRYDSSYQAVSTLTEGMFFGELSFFDSQERSADVIAREDLLLFVLKKQDFDKIIKENLKDGCKIQRKIITNLISIIRKMDETYSDSIFLR